MCYFVWVMYCMLSFCMLCCLCCLSWLIDNTFQLFKAKKIDKVNNSVLTGGLLIITRDIACCCCYCSECASTLGVEATRQAFFFFCFRGLTAVVLAFLLFGVIHTPDGPFVRPHPGESASRWWDRKTHSIHFCTSQMRVWVFGWTT